jgi:N-acetylglucosaminyldiphosphoundecaprenol N-acetyl-beta-D-mannosaminyltransferase
LNSRTNVLGVGISLINMRMAVDRLDQWIAERDHQYVCVCSVHGVMQCQRDERLRRIINAAGMATPDGMPLVWLSRLSGYRHVSRVYGPDLLLAEMAASLKVGHRHFFYGGRDGVADRLADRMRQRFPGVSIVGTLTPPLGSVDELCNAQTASAVNAARPDIVWVGISTPKQEHWMACMRPLLEAPVLIGVGAAFDFHTGTIPQAPPWMQRAGVEWLFRLIQEPERLWKRYLVENPPFLWKIARQKLRLKRYELS